MTTVDLIIGEDPNVILQKAFVNLQQTVCHNDPISVIINQFRKVSLTQGKRKKSIFK